MSAQRHRILVVEDENIVAMDLRASLGALGYDVTDTVGTGLQAIESVRLRRPSLVLMDIQLRGDMDGISAAARIREFDVPVVYLTAFSDSTTVGRANVSEPFGYLLKPFDERELHIVVEMAIYRHRAQKEHEQLVREQVARAAVERENLWAQFFAEASRQLSASLDVQETLETVTRLAIPRLADLTMVHAKSDDGFQTIAVHGGEKEEVVQQILRRYPPDPELRHGFPRVIASGASEVIYQVEDAALARVAVDEEHLRLLRAVGLRAHICVPLVVRGQTWGAMTFAITDSNRRYEPEDLAHAEELGRRCAMAIDNARLYQQAKEAIARRDEFLSVASHELRTPLAALQLTLQRFERALARSDVDDVKNRMDRAHRQIARLAELTEKLLDVSRIGSGKLELNLEEVDLVPLVRDMVERLSEAALQAGSLLTIHVPDTLVATCDRMRMDQVVTNLLSNAIKFGSANPIEVTLLGDDHKAELFVQDHGIGISPSKLEHVFDRFERAVSGRHYSGLGLGLYITRQIIEAHGGVARVESQIGSGSVFVVSVPRRPEPNRRG